MDGLSGLGATSALLRTYLYKEETVEEDVTPGINIISESGHNILSNDGRPFSLISSPLMGFSTVSSEGFAHNIEMQQKLARFLITELGLKSRGPLLDVGFGTNIHIANTFANAGINSYVLDRRDHSGSEDENNPLKLKARGVSVLVGDITEVGKLCRKKFGTILFNGSWTAGGNNWTISLIGESKYHSQFQEAQRGSRIIEIESEFIDREKHNVLSACKRALAPNGVIGVVSSRYAFHGAGFNFDQLPEEKLSFLDLYERFQSLGAKRIYLFGLSQNGFNKALELSRKINQEYIDSQTGGNTAFSPKMLSQDEIWDIRCKLCSIADLPCEDVYSRHTSDIREKDYQAARIRKALEAAKLVPELNKLARIDAIFAEF